MRALMVVKRGDLGGLAALMVDQGDDVKYFSSSDLVPVPEGVEPVKSWRPHLKWADAVLFDAFATSTQFEALNRLKLPLLGIGMALQDWHKMCGTAMFGIGIPTRPKAKGRTVLALIGDTHVTMFEGPEGRRPPGYVLPPTAALGSLFRAVGYRGPIELRCARRGVSCPPSEPAWGKLCDLIRSRDAIVSSVLVSLLYDERQPLQPRRRWF